MFSEEGRFLKRGKNENEQIKKYFKECIENINASNLYMLRKVCMYISLVYVFMLGLAVLFVPDFHITFAYALMIPLLGIYFFINLYTRKPGRRIGTNLTGIICCTFYFWLGIVFIMMDAVSFPNAQALWTPMIIVVFPTIYIDRMYKYGFEELTMMVIYSIFAYVYKPLDVFVTDMYAILAAYVLSMLSAHIILEMRSREGLAMTELKRLSSLDKLTHVLNKGALVEQIASYYDKKNANSVCSMCIVDLDDFKQVNDNLGHNTGDLLLERVGQLLIDSFRNYDIIGRYGGDEFVVLMPNMGDVSILEMRCRTLQMFLTDFSVGNGQPFSVSIGAIVDRGNHTSDEVFQMADDALYKSKLSGKSRCTTWVVDREPISEKPMLLVVTKGGCANTARLFREERARFEILTASNDDEALCFISQYHDQIRLVFLEMDATDDLILKYVKTRESFVNLPILAIAADDDAFERAKQLSADAVLMTDSPGSEYKKIINKYTGF